MEQEMASIIKFVYDHAGAPSPYYWNVPQHFAVPAVYFPVPELSAGGETFLTYRTDFTWYIHFFHRTAQGVWSMGRQVLAAVCQVRNLIPLIDTDGAAIAGEWVRVEDPQLKVVDNGAAELTINWRSRRPYADTVADRTPVRSIDVNVFMKSGKTISDAMAAALEQYIVSD